MLAEREVTDSEFLAIEQVFPPKDQTQLSIELNNAAVLINRETIKILGTLTKRLNDKINKWPLLCSFYDISNRKQQQ